MCSLSSTTIIRLIGIFGVVSNKSNFIKYIHINFILKKTYIKYNFQLTSLLLINLLAKTDLNLQENVQPTTKILLGLEWRDLVPFENRNLPKGK